MRVPFVKSIDEVLSKNSESLFLTGDLGFNAFEGLAEKFGRRFLNAGVAEQNMVGMAAGMALSGFSPWVYSIAPFVTYRCLEQIRNDVCLHQLPVHLVGNGGGYTYGIMGATHHALEDLGVLKTLPNMTLYFPQSEGQVEQAVSLIHQNRSPSYLRLAISGFPANLSPLIENPVTLTRQYTQGKRRVILAVGHAVQVVLSALRNFPKELEDCAIFGLSRFPFDFESDSFLLDAIRDAKDLVLVDEHYRSGSIAESFRAALPFSPPTHWMTATYSKGQRYGSSQFHLKQSFLTPDHLATL